MKSIQQSIALQEDEPTVRTDMPAREVAALLAKHQVCAVPVIDDGGVLVGAVSLVDLIPTGDGDPIFAGLRRRRWYEQPDGVTAGDLMTRAARHAAFARAVAPDGEPPHDLAAAS